MHVVQDGVKSILSRSISVVHSFDEEMKKIVLKVVKRYGCTEGVEVDCISNDILLEDGFRLKKLRMVMEPIEKVVTNLGAAKLGRTFD
ncbi:hypothetical protein VNO77_20150 [Canavalia gladiata]|uniref:Uncharacterized protein n=1 Tax=Canavalia gladiata TaxID=3824 RepID=A0AAN9LP08_CANGL